MKNREITNRQRYEGRTGMPVVRTIATGLGSAVLAWLCTSSSLNAQQAKGGREKESASSLSQLLARAAEAPQIRLRETASTNGAAPDSAALEPPREPKEMAGAFFENLSSQQVDEAFTLLTKGSNLAKRERDLTLFRERTRQVIEDYGQIAGHELLEEKSAGTNLLRLTYISLAERYPLRWRLYFYKAQDRWEIIDMRVDDNLRALFQEDAPAPGGPGLASSGAREE